MARDYCHYGMKTKAAVELSPPVPASCLLTLPLLSQVTIHRAEDLLNVRDEAARSFSTLLLLFGIVY